MENMLHNCGKMISWKGRILEILKPPLIQRKKDLILKITAKDILTLVILFLVKKLSCEDDKLAYL